MSGMILKSRIVNLCYFWVLIKISGNSHCIFILAIYPKLQRFHSAYHVIGRFRMKRCAGYFAIVENCLDELFFAANKSAQRIGVAAKEFCGAVDYQVNAK